MTLVATAALAACTLSDADRAWMGELRATWETASRVALLEEPRALPWIVFFDETCAWQVKPGAAPEGTEHGGKIPTPDGGSVPPRLMTFVATYGDKETPFLVMSMPSIWRADPRHAGNAMLPQLMRAVFTHEMTHVRQTAGLGSRIGQVERQFGLPSDFNDDIVQNRFADRPGFREAYERERDLLYRAFGETNADARRALVREAAAAMRARRAKYFTGGDAVFAELEDIFLGMEGFGQFAAYRAAMRDGIPADEAITMMRGGGRFWSQDEGLAAVLVIDALLPGWQRRVLASNIPGVLQLLTEAAGRK